MCTEQSHPNNKKEIRHGSFKRFKSCFIFQLNRVVSGEFMCSYTSTLRDGRMTLRVIPSRNGAPASLHQQCHLSTGTGSGLPLGIAGCNWERECHSRGTDCTFQEMYSGYCTFLPNDRYTAALLFKLQVFRDVNILNNASICAKHSL